MVSETTRASSPKNLPTVQERAVVGNITLRNDGVILYGEEVWNNQHPGNQQFKMLIQKCIQHSLQTEHAIDNVAEALWKEHTPRKFWEWKRDSASCSELSKCYALDLIKHALCLGDQEDRHLFETAWEHVNATADQGVIIDNDEAGAYLRCFPDDRDGSQRETYPVDHPLDW